MTGHFTPVQVQSAEAEERDADMKRRGDLTWRQAERYCKFTFLSMYKMYVYAYVCTEGQVLDFIFD